MLFALLALSLLNNYSTNNSKNSNKNNNKNNNPAKAARSHGSPPSSRNCPGRKQERSRCSLLIFMTKNNTS